MLLAWVKFILLHYTKTPSKKLIRFKFLKDLGQSDNQRSGTRLSQTNPRFSLVIVVVKDNFAPNNIVILVSYLASTLIFSIMKLGKKVKQYYKRFNT